MRAQIEKNERPDNVSGIYPVEYKVLIEPIEVEAKIGSILIPDGAKDSEQHAQMEGVIIAISPMAFAFEEWPSWARHPQAGDRVLFAKYAGTLVDGRDGKKYRLVNDRDVAALLQQA